MESRREFLKKAALLSGAAMFGVVPESIARAIAINPELGSTYLDAEHIVILMQENRSFDHSYGTLQGVRGYNDPRAHLLPNLNPVWLQTNVDGETYAPFRLNIKETNVTWMGSLPHAWGNQVDARNDGRYDKWLIVKPSGYQGFAKKPMTLGHYTREDLPFYYAFADAFTICDQHFCSALTGTTPNRLYFWTGTIRPEQNADSKAHVYNEETDFGAEVSWPTFPERLEDAGISWKIYQNELSVQTGLHGEFDSWLSNFSDNPIEYFTQYGVYFYPRHQAYLQTRQTALQAEIADLEKANDADTLAKRKAELEKIQKAIAEYSRDNWDKLPQRSKNLHAKAFCTNENDPHFRELDTLTYDDAGIQSIVKVPKGDIYHQFRQDVQSGNLPTVSWIVGPEHFSDHPSSAWYGAWYVSEALDILTQNPDVWKKTIFILTYDENDGYFDHVPPFVAPNPYKADSGKVSEGIDATVEYITHDQDLKFRPHYKPRESSIGLGYRVPLVVASPWSRGGCVNSEVFDHTSVLQFLEHYLTHKTGKHIQETNISTWRRTICGDLTSIFKPYHGEPTPSPTPLKRDEFIESIHKARLKAAPAGFKVLTAEDIAEIKQNPASANLPSQEKGTRPSCPLPYELLVDGHIAPDGSALQIDFKVAKDSAGSPFNTYAYKAANDLQARAYAVAPGKAVSDTWTLSDFPEGRYHVRVDGPNGFMRLWKGSTSEPHVDVTLAYAKGRKAKPSGALEILVKNPSAQTQTVELTDAAYGAKPQQKTIPAGATAKFNWPTDATNGWYDLSVKIAGYDAYQHRSAGRVETGQWTTTDPAMARA